MLSGFPQQEANDPEGYVAGLLTIATLYSEEALVAVVERSFPFLPNRYQWRQALEEQAVWLTRLAAMQKARQVDLPPLPQIAYELPRYEPDPDVDPVTGKHVPGTILRQYGRWAGLYGRPRERP